jgi:hypothetical protein
MSEAKWKKWLKTKKIPHHSKEDKENKRKQIQRERKMLFDIRKRAIRAVEELTFILRNLPNVSDNPEADYARIFRDEKSFVDFFNECRRSFYYSFKSKTRLFAQENRDALLTACSISGITIRGERALANRHYRAELWEELKKERKNGKNEFADVYDNMIFNKYYKLLENSHNVKEINTANAESLNESLNKLDLYENTRRRNALHMATRLYKNVVEKDREGLEKLVEDLKSTLNNDSFI